MKEKEEKYSIEEIDEFLESINEFSGTLSIVGVAIIVVVLLGEIIF